LPRCRPDFALTPWPGSMSMVRSSAPRADHWSMTLRNAARGVAIILFVWAALVAATWITKGNYSVLVAAGLALLAFGCDPWPRNWGR
jgi:hypothetical protein